MSRKHPSHTPARPSRRSFLAQSALGTAAAGTLGHLNTFAAQPTPDVAAKAAKAAEAEPFNYQGGKSPWPLCLDTTTLAKDIPLEKKIELAADAGFDAIEPWDRELTAHEKNGGDLNDLGRKIRDLGLFVPSVIGLWGCMAHTKDEYTARLDEQKNRLRMISAIGSQHVQVIPDFKEKERFNKETAAWCYRQISELAATDYDIQTGVIFLNFMPQLKTIADATEVAMLADWPDAKIIPDTYHLYHGQGKLNSLRHLNGDFIAIFQFADAPEGLEVMDGFCDKHRVLPGDGMLPLVESLQILRDIHFTGCISLELYNPEYRKREPVAFLKEAHAKTLAVIEKAVAPPTE